MNRRKCLCYAKVIFDISARYGNFNKLSTIRVPLVDIRGRIWERIVSIKDESSIEEEDPEERFEDPDNDDDEEEERLEDPEELEEIPVKGLEEDPEDKLEDEVPEKDEELEEDPEETEAGLGTISTNPGCSVLSSV